MRLGFLLKVTVVIVVIVFTLPLIFNRTDPAELELKERVVRRVCFVYICWLFYKCLLAAVL